MVTLSKVFIVFILLIGGVIYLISPIDLIPDIFPIIGAVDDIVIVIAIIVYSRRTLKPVFRLFGFAKKLPAKFIESAFFQTFVKMTFWVSDESTKIYYSTIKNPILTSLIVFLFLYSVLWFLGGRFFSYNDNEFVTNILVEYHGMLLDIIVFGVLIALFNNAGNRKKDINRYLEEIDDFRFWKEPEATYRIVGNVKRLVKLGHNEIDLEYCFLENANMKNLDLSGSSFVQCDFSKAEINNLSFNNCDFTKASFENTQLVSVDFSSSNLSNSNWTNSIIIGTNFSDCNMQNISLDGAKVDSENWIENLLAKRVKGYQFIKETFIVNEELMKCVINGKEIEYYSLERKKSDNMVYPTHTSP